jgi:outer membrane cobalamin receptor
MDEKALAEYKARCEAVQAMYQSDYSNPELEELMKSPQWEAIKKQLTTSERKQIKAYLNYIQDRSFGCIPSQITAWENLVKRIKEILNPKPQRKRKAK